jgi:alpha-L-rhamnosidase
VGLGARGLQRIDPARLRRTAAVVGTAVLLAGARLDGTGRASGWSALAWWETGLLEAADWKVSWIEPDLADDVSKPGPVPMLRREFKLKGPVERARAYVTEPRPLRAVPQRPARGDQLFTPGWTSYNKRLQYQTYDVTPLLKTGTNAVGRSWQRLVSREPGLENRRNIYGDRLGLLAQIDITYKDGAARPSAAMRDGKRRRAPS